MGQKIRAKFALVGVAGLPFSGKSTLLRNILELKSKPEEATNGAKSLSIFEAVMMQEECTKARHWIPSTKDDAENITLIATLARVFWKLPSHDTDADPSRIDPVFGDNDLDRIFHESTMKNLEDITKHLNTSDIQKLLCSSLTFVNLWDVGVSKAIFEVLPIIAPRYKNLLLLNVLSLARDADNGILYKPPDLTDKQRYNGRYQSRGDENTLLRRRSALFYYVRCITVAQRTLMVGTFADDLDSMKRQEAAEKVLREVRTQVKKVGIREDAIYPELFTVDAREEADAMKVRTALEDLIDANDQYEREIPLYWIFLRCALHRMGRLYMLRGEVFSIGRKCGLHDEKELDEWLELFQNCGSIIYIPSDEQPMLHSFVILDPLKFFRDLDRLYYVVELKNVQPELESHVAHARSGLLSHRLLKHICSDSEEHYNLYARVLQCLGFMVEAGELYEPADSCLQQHSFYFMPSLRMIPHVGAYEEEALFVLYPKHIRFDNQPKFVKLFKQQFGKEVKLIHDQENCYNVLQFAWSEEAGEAVISIRFDVDIAQVFVKFLSHSQPFQKKLFSILKAACITVFNETVNQYPGMQYNLAVMCPQSDSDSHVVSFNPCNTTCNLFCPDCKQDVEITNGSTKWIQTAYQVLL